MSYSFQYIEGQETYTSNMAFELFEIDRNFFPTPWSIESWINLCDGHNRLLILLKNGNDTIGFCLFDKVIQDSFAHLLKILIIPSYQKLGLSKELLNKALLVLCKSGCTHYFLEVEQSNITAQKLYLSSGFKIIHRKKDFYGENRDALIMTKD